MGSDYDVIVVGAGISGACVARELSKYRLRTAVLEKGSDLCSGATKGNSATVHSGHDAAYGTKKAYYNVRGNAMYDKMCEELSVPFVRNGTIVFALNDADRKEIGRLKENADRNGVPDVRILYREELTELEPGWGEEVKAALYAPTGGMVCPYTLVFALCENALGNGVQFYLNTKVTNIRKREGGFLVETDRGEFTCRFLFNCAGTHADEINNFVSENKFRIIPRKGSHIILDKKLSPYVKATLCQTPFTLPGGGHTKGMGIMPTVDHTVILGCEAREAEDKDDVSTSREGLNTILDYFETNWKYLPVSRAFPKFPRELIIGSFAGLRPHPDTDDFILGEAKDVPGFINMAGIESPGVTAAPAIAADLVKESAENYRWEENPDFNPIRYVQKPFRDMTDKERENAIRKNPDYGKLICRCEQVTKAEILEAIRGPLGARSVNAVKMRTRAGMGRCQGGFCGPEVVRILSEELGVPMTEVVLDKPGSCILTSAVGGGTESISTDKWKNEKENRGKEGGRDERTEL